MATHTHMSFLILVYVLLGALSSSKFGCESIVGDYRNISCIESEKQALLLLKESLVDDLHYLSSWIGGDCCAWHGIGCNNRTGHVIQLDLRNGYLKGDKIYPSLLDLKFLTYLDLSNNRFEGMKIPQFFGSFKDLTYLNLSHSNLEGLVPHSLANLSKLQYLDLSSNIYYHDYINLTGTIYFSIDNVTLLLSIDSMRWLSGLSMLKHLDLSFVNLSKATDWVSSINMLSNSILELGLFSCHLSNNIPRHLPFINLKSLISLDLGYNNLKSSFPLRVLKNSGLAHLYLRNNHFDGLIPDSLGTLTSLLEIDLSFNNFNGSIPESIGRLISLSSLDVSFNEFQGPLPESIGRLTSLTDLDLSVNQFKGFFPKSMGNLTSLSTLDLSRNNFSGSIPGFIGSLTSLTYLNLAHNHFQGLIPHSIGNLTSLYELDFFFNELSGSIPREIGNLTELGGLMMRSNELSGGLPEEVCQMSKSEFLYVDDNQLSGSIPECIGELSNLIYLFLGTNSWEGFVTEHHFVNLTQLTMLFISSKSSLALDVSNNWVPPFQLQNMYIESMKVGPKFPHWLLTQRQAGDIRMQNTSISDTIPTDWFVSLLSQASRVDLSDNDINVERLSSISAVPNGLSILALSNNRLSGEFPSSFCNGTSLDTLIISNNYFSGELPQCLGNLTKLRYFDVMNNSFSGEIPVSLGSLVNLTYLNLHKNKFQGKLPMSFQNLKELVALDVGKNNLSDILPPWPGAQLPHLKYLILRSNNFFGEIPTQLCHYSSLQVLNLAKNKIRGNIPPCFGNLSAMITGDNHDLNPGFDSYRGQMIIDDVKGNELKYTSTLGFLYSIDLSNNNISGEIPQELMDLHGLKNLDLAGNNLAGRIPDSIGKLQNLVYLDLSRNELNGSIPQSLSNLNFLTSLNLSFNDLSGRIPTGNQLQTLDDPSIYAGNNEICGQPILKPCAGDTELRNVQDHNEADSDSDDERMWFYAGIGPGLLCGFLGFCASLYFIKSWRDSYFYFMELGLYKIAVAIVLLRRKVQN